MDLDEDIPGLLLGNTTLKERQVIADWVQDALTHKAAWEQRRKIQDIAGSFRTDQQVMSTIPTLTEQNIRTFVGEQNFQKGRQLAHDRAILNPEQQAVALKAYCYGSLPEPYRVQVTFDGPRINSYLCSCPAGTSVDTNRGCEHKEEYND